MRETHSSMGETDADERQHWHWRQDWRRYSHATKASKHHTCNSPKKAHQATSWSPVYPHTTIWHMMEP